MKRIIHFIFNALIFLASSEIIAATSKPRPNPVAKEAKAPPVGKRIYVVDPNDPSKPVSIEPMGARSSGVVLKDPLTTAPHAKVEAPRPAPVAKPRVASRSHLNFRRMPISGELIRPRVEFRRDLLPVGRVDEPLRPDFFQKVYDPARDETF